jgi:hypothetical protein
MSAYTDALCKLCGAKHYEENLYECGPKDLDLRASKSPEEWERLNRENYERRDPTIKAERLAWEARKAKKASEAAAENAAARNA